MIEKHIFVIERRINWTVPVVLLALSAVPVLAGVIRLVGLMSGGPINQENARFFAAPLPIMIHLVSATLFCLLGAFQFPFELRLRRINWHRINGRLLVPCGLLAALSGIWMTVVYPIDSQYQGLLLFSSRLLVGSSIVASIILSLLAIARRDIAKHEAWMIRAYALGLGAGTQVVVALPWIVIYGELIGLQRDILLSSAWGINLALAERVIYNKKITSLGH